MNQNRQLSATTRDLVLLIAVMVALCALAARGESLSQGLSIGLDGVRVPNGGPRIGFDNGVLSSQFSLFGNGGGSNGYGGYTTVVPKGVSVNPTSLTPMNEFFKPYPKDPPPRSGRPLAE